MLQQLHIKNYAIIDFIEISFNKGLNIITGETGAGKSILMGALGLILGERADASALQQKESKCIIEGSFAHDKAGIKNFLLEHDIEQTDELLLRREIAANGKSRAFINDTPVSLQQIKKIAGLLVDLHQQFDTLDLADADFQREVLDALADNAERLKEYQKQFIAWHKAVKELEELQKQKAEFNKEAGYNRFLFTELCDASFKKNEIEEAEAELKLLSNAENIKAALSKIYFDLKGSEQPVVYTLKQINNQLSPFVSFHTILPELLKRINSTHAELQDIAEEISALNEKMQTDERRAEQLNERLDTGYKLLKKHGIKTTAELLLLQSSLEEKLRAVLQIDDTIVEREKQTAAMQQQLISLAKIISEERKKQVAPFEKKVNGLLSNVGMPNASVKVEITETGLHYNGADETGFLFDANKTKRYQPISKVASGGELSRLMLCIKSLVAEKIDLPTLIFDEIDTGISGEAAKQVGVILKELGVKRQVICITHQPQIAGKANAHYFVYKEAIGNKVKTNIRLLNKDERITTIAQMLSGEKPTAAALENAKEMVGQSGG